MAVAVEHPRRSRTAALASALAGSRALLDQAVAALRAWPPADDLAAAGVADPADLPVSLADRALLTLHEEVVGAPLEHTVVCPACGERTTLPLSRADVGEHDRRSAWTGAGAGVREPTWADVLAARGDPEALLRRCSVGAGGTFDDLARVEGSLSGPLHADCAACRSPLEVDVDVVALVLRELAAVPAELDHDVHVLASRYGWDLEVIEALPDDRRRRLVDLARGEQ